ncbi:hypothetical protein Rumi2_11580 [[Ruminococcus] torques]|nr:hypothetical protein Rumi1_16470 [[Ruminococcus] torques]BEI77998.1 hypothetical protein Rumi2_11580 [[Ruminococcus] torques]
MYEVATQQSGEMVSRNTQTEMMISRQAQEVQGAMVIAKRFPRDEVESFNRIMQSCKRKSLAESAMYEYPRGGTKVSGPLSVLPKQWRRTGEILILELRNWSRKMGSHRLWPMRGIWRQIPVRSKYLVFRMFAEQRREMSR